MGLNLYIRAWYNGLSSLSYNCRRRRRAWPKIVRRAQQVNFLLSSDRHWMRLIKFDLAKPPLFTAAQPSITRACDNRFLIEKSNQPHCICPTNYCWRIHSIPIIKKGQTIQLVILIEPDRFPVYNGPRRRVEDLSLVPKKLVLKQSWTSLCINGLLLDGVRNVNGTISFLN